MAEVVAVVVGFVRQRSNVAGHSVPEEKGKHTLPLFRQAPNVPMAQPVQSSAGLLQCCIPSGQVSLSSSAKPKQYPTSSRLQGPNVPPAQSGHTSGVDVAVDVTVVVGVLVAVELTVVDPVVVPVEVWVNVPVEVPDVVLVDVPVVVVVDDSEVEGVEVTEVVNVVVLLLVGVVDPVDVRVDDPVDVSVVVGVEVLVSVAVDVNDVVVEVVGVVV